MSLVKIYMAMGGGWSISGCTEPIHQTSEAIVSSPMQPYQNVPAQPYQNVPLQSTIDANESNDNSVKPTTDGGVVRMQNFNYSSNANSAGQVPIQQPSPVLAQQHNGDLSTAPHYPMPATFRQNPPVNPQAIYAPTPIQAQMSPHRPTFNAPSPQPVSYVAPLPTGAQNPPTSPGQFRRIEPNNYGPPRNAAVQWMQR